MSHLFKKSWENLGIDFVGTVEEFFLQDLFLTTNHMIIALVPKSSHLPTVGDYSLVAYCNAIYKVITKILALRLGHILKTILDQADATFAEKWSMMEKIHLARKLLRQYNRKRVAPKCLLKIDLRKIYESINWVKAMLERI